MLNLDDIKMFVAVYDECSYTAAARSLGYTPPTLHQRIARLSRQAGGPLFVYHSRMLRPTKHAYRIIEPCRELLRAVTVCERVISGDAKENVIPGLLYNGHGRAILYVAANNRQQY